MASPKKCDHAHSPFLGGIGAVESIDRRSVSDGLFVCFPPNERKQKLVEEKEENFFFYFLDGQKEENKKRKEKS